MGAKGVTPEPPKPADDPLCAVPASVILRLGSGRGLSCDKPFSGRAPLSRGVVG